MAQCRVCRNRRSTKPMNSAIGGRRVTFITNWPVQNMTLEFTHHLAVR
jgi:hypothetical protein